MRNMPYPATIGNSINHAGFNRADVIKTSYEGKRVGLSSKLNKDSKPSTFGSRNYSLQENRANSTLRNPNKLAPLSQIEKQSALHKKRASQNVT